MATTITVEEETLERFNQMKADQNEPDIPEMNADLFLNSLMDTVEAVEDGHYGESDDPLTFSEVDEISEQLTPEVDEDRIADVLAERLPERIARELEGRLR